MQVFNPVVRKKRLAFCRAFAFSRQDNTKFAPKEGHFILAALGVVWRGFFVSFVYTIRKTVFERTAVPTSALSTIKKIHI